MIDRTVIYVIASFAICYVMFFRLLTNEMFAVKKLDFIILTWDLFGHGVHKDTMSARTITRVSIITPYLFFRNISID